MSVYREIPLSFGTLVLAHPAGNPDAVEATWKVSSPVSFYQAPNDVGCDSDALVAEKDPPDPEMASVGSVTMSSDDGPLSVFGDDVTENASSKTTGEQLDEACTPVVGAKGTPNLCSMRSWTHNSAAGTFDLGVKIGPTTWGTATLQKPHTCDICGRPFKRRKDIRRHRETHNSDKPFLCQVCFLAFRSRENLRRHLTRVHPRPDVSRHAQNDGSLKGYQLQMEIMRERMISALERRPAGENGGVNASDEEAGIRGKNGEMSVDEPNAKSDQSVQNAEAPTPTIGVRSSSDLSSQPQPDAASAPSPKKPVSSPYSCDGCGRNTSCNNVMVFKSKQAVSTATVRVLCKACFIKKTGIICIG